MLGNGLTGILKPCGEFVECEYGYFMKLVKELPTDEQNDLIILSSIGNGTHGTIYKYSLEIGSHMSDEQFKWLKENFERLSINQKEMIKDWLELLKLQLFEVELVG